MRTRKNILFRGEEKNEQKKTKNGYCVNPLLGLIFLKGLVKGTETLLWPFHSLPVCASGVNSKCLVRMQKCNKLS